MQGAYLTLRGNLSRLRGELFPTMCCGRILSMWDHAVAAGGEKNLGLVPERASKKHASVAGTRYSSATDSSRP